MSSDQDRYEIYAVAKKNWRLLTHVPTSGQAIEEATKLQHTEKYAAIQVIVRPATETVSPRLLYQFTRPGARLLDQDPLLQSLGACVTDGNAASSQILDGGRQNADRFRRALIIASCGCIAAMAVLFLTFAFAT